MIVFIVNNSYFKIWMRMQNALAQEKHLKQLCTFIDTSSFIFLSWMTSGEWRVNYVSQNIDQLGYTQEEFILGSKKFLQIIYPEDLSRVMMEIETHKNSDVGCFNQIYRIVSANSDIRWVDLHTVIERDSFGKAINFFSMLKDVTNEKTQTIANNSVAYSLKELSSMKILAQAIKQTDDMVLITNNEGVITFVNDALLKHSGYTVEETIGQKPHIFKSGKHDKSFYENFWTVILKGKAYHGIFKNRKKSGKIYHESKTVTPIMDENSGIQYFVATGKDISDRVAFERELRKQANIDLLTGIYNRQRFVKEIESELDRLKRYNSKFTLMMLDLDHFKEVNDTYGHDVGDKVLQNMCKLIGSKIRKSDIFARWGGEEFMIISPGLDKDKVTLLAHKLKSSVESYIFDNINKITISIGITIPKAEDTLKDLVKRVDNALYQAKHNGRNQIHFI